MAEQEMMMENQVRKTDLPEVQSEKELQLIQELVSIRKETNRTLEYETLGEYRMPPGTHFAMLKKPAVSIKYGRMTFNMAAIRMFEGTANILPMIHEGKHRLAVVPCKEEESDSVEWARINKHGKWVNKDIRSEEFVKSIFDLMGWDPACRYKVQGRIANSERGLIFVFDLDVCIKYEKGKETVTDPVTGKMKQRQKMQYIDNFDGHIGRKFEDYEATRAMSQFENIEEYAGAEPAEGQLNVRAEAADHQRPADQTARTAVIPAPEQQTLFSSGIYRPGRETAPDDDQDEYQGYYDAAGGR